MQERIDSRLLIEQRAPIKESELQLELNTDPNIPKEALISQIDSKINFLLDQKNKYDAILNEKINEFHKKGKKEDLDLSEKIQPSINVAQKALDDINNIDNQYKALEQNLKPLLNAKDAMQRRESLKLIKNEAIAMRDYFALYEEIKKNFEHRNFFKVSQLASKVNTLAVKDKSLITNYLSNFSKAVNDQLFKNCMSEFSVASIFQCLVFIKNPEQVFNVITNKISFDFSKVDSFENKSKPEKGIIGYYQYRFDVINTIFKLQHERIYLNKDKNIWDIPMRIWSILVKQNIPNKDAFVNFIINLNTDNNPLFPFLINKWDRIESLLYLTKPFPAIAYKIVKDILAKCCTDPNKINLIQHYLMNCFELYNTQARKNNNNFHAPTCCFVQEIIENVFYFLVSALINNEFNRQDETLKARFSIYKDESFRRFELSDKLTIEPGSFEGVPKEHYILKYLFDFYTTITDEKNGNITLIAAFYDNEFDKKIRNIFVEIPKFLLPLYFGSNKIIKCYQNEKEFTALELNKVFEFWYRFIPPGSITYEDFYKSIRETAIRYFNYAHYSKKKTSLFKKGKADFRDLFNRCYPI